MEMPTIPIKCVRPNTRVTSQNWLSTMSLMVKMGNPGPGCAPLLEGEDDVPLPKASTAMTKYLELSTSLPGPICQASCALVPCNHGASTTAFDLDGFNRPNVRYPIWQFLMRSPLSSRKSPRSATRCPEAARVLRM